MVSLEFKQYFYSSVPRKISYGIVGGLGLGLMYVPAVTAVGYWFEKKRSLVTGEMSKLFYLQRFSKKIRDVVW